MSITNLTPIDTLDDVTRFNVIKEPVFDSQNNRIKGLFSLMREDTRCHMGVCKEKYRPIQVDEMLEVLNTATNNIGDINHKGFVTSGGGRRMVIQSEIANPINISGDIVNGIFYTVIDNTGMSSNKIIPSTLRLVCTNQLHLIKRAAGNIDGVRHASTFSEKVKMLTHNIRMNIDTIHKFSNTAESLRNTSFTPNEMWELIKEVLPPVTDKNETPQLKNKRELIFNFFENGRGNEGKTRWDALNAFTEFESSKKFTAEKFVRTLTTDNLSNRALNILTAV